MTGAQTLIGLDPKLIFDLASMVDPPHVVAQNYGLDPTYLQEVIETPHVKRLIRAKRKELDEAGFVLATKAKLMFEDLLPDIYKKAKSENTTLGGVLEAAKFLRVVAGLDQQAASAATQEKFSITIQFSNAPQTQPVTIDVAATPVAELDNPPAYIPRASNADLEYVE